MALRVPARDVRYGWRAYFLKKTSWRSERLRGKATRSVCRRVYKGRINLPNGRPCRTLFLPAVAWITRPHSYPRDSRGLTASAGAAVHRCYRLWSVAVPRPPAASAVSYAEGVTVMSNGGLSRLGRSLRGERPLCRGALRPSRGTTHRRSCGRPALSHTASGSLARTQ